jgi:DNA-binding PadR family transcriptional regulator
VTSKVPTSGSRAPVLAVQPDQRLVARVRVPSSRYGRGMADARLTTPAFLVLGIIDILGEASPYDVKVQAARTVAPFWSVPHAQVYAQCDRLVEAGLLSEVRQNGGRNRRVMTLTTAGKAALQEWLADPDFVPVEARERGILKLWFGAQPGVIAPVQLAEHRRTQADYEQLAERVGDLLTRGQREALEFGIRYERMMVDFWQWVAQRGS